MTDIFKRSLTEESFDRLSELITARCGIKMPRVKKLMLEGRLRKRLRALGMNCFEQYCDYLFSEDGMESELVHMIDVVTTNKTEFFREPDHFDYLAGQALPDLVDREGAGIRKRLTVWSAGCATGEEPYTIAMVINEFAEPYNDASFDFVVLATDVSTQVLEKAKLGIYREDKAGSVKEELRKKYLMRGKGGRTGHVRIAPGLRSRVRFGRLNFMEADFGIREPVDIVFCRNVIIYFDRQTQEQILGRIIYHIRRGGYLFIGHAETLSYLNMPIAQVAPSVYKKVM
jgi:chemotaxis protein methyltransferase CheR